MKRILAVVIVLGSITATGALAQGVSSASLSGFYILQASGFDANDFQMGTPNTVHTGGVSLLGVLQFDGVGNFTGTLSLTSADSGGTATSPAQAACIETLTGTDGQFSVTPACSTPGIDAPAASGTLSITFDSTSKTSSGTINFNTVISNGGNKVFLLESDASVGKVNICGRNKTLYGTIQ